MHFTPVTRQAARLSTSFTFLAASLAFAGCGESTPAEAPSAPLEAPTAPATSTATNGHPPCSLSDATSEQSRTTATTDPPTARVASWPPP